MVVLFHAGLRWAPGGYLGVDVFLVISGYLIIGHLVSEARRTGTIALGRFWGRRALRLIPASTVVILATILASALVASPTEFANYAKSGRAAAAYTSNFLFLGYGTDYFRASAEQDPFLHTWSLALEEQFYLVVAPSVMLIAYGVARVWSGRVSRTDDALPTVRPFVLAFAIVAILSYALYGVTSQHEPMRAFYMLAPRAWEFAVGGLIALASPAMLRLSPTVRSRSGWIALLALVVAMHSLAFNGARAWLIALVPVLATAVLIAAGDGVTGIGVQRLLTLAPLRFLGRVSYSWYLWHWPLASLWPLFPWAESIPLVVGMPPFSLCLATVTYYLVEARFRSYEPLSRSPSRSLAVGGALLVATVLVATAGRRLAARELAKPAYAAVLQSRVFDEAVRQCELGFGEQKMRVCVIGDARSARTIALFGDSHAAQIAPAVHRAAQALHIKVLYFEKAGCPWVDVTPFAIGQRIPYQGCVQWRRAVVQYLSQHPPALVVLGARGRFTMVDATGAPFTAEDDSVAYSSAWSAGAASVLQELSKHSHVLVVRNVPEPHDDVSTCVERHIQDAVGCDFPRDRALAGPPWGIDIRVARSVAGVNLLDLTDEICGVALCHAVVRGQVTYRDGNHLGAPFVLTMVPRFEREIAAAITSGAARPVSQ